MNIPAFIRKQLGLSKNSKALVSVKDGGMLVRPIKDFLELKGSISIKKKPLTNSELHEFFAQELVKKNS
jgi:bifunctional DNA-binding transcriptional regulator/antitoxin component of YhaV-PrlF toxin-antitoxin module